MSPRHTRASEGLTLARVRRLRLARSALAVDLQLWDAVRMGAELRVDGGRVVALSRVVAEAGMSLDPESLRTAGARVSAGLPGARLASAAVTACADLGEAVGRLAAACAGWEQDVAAALASLSEVDDDAAADLRSQFGRGRQRAL